MATPTTTASSAGIGDDTTQTVYDTAALEAFRTNLVFRRNADVKWSISDGPMRGSSVVFTKLNALAVATTALSETADPTPVTITDSTVTLTPVEYGNVVKTTEKFRATSFLNADLTIAREVALNMEESVDRLAANQLIAGTNVSYVGQSSRAAITASNTLTGNHIKLGRNQLAKNNVPFPADSTGMGNLRAYLGITHPDPSYDLQVESGQAAWSAPQIYREGGNDGVWTGELGAFGGVFMVESANPALLIADAGATSTVDVYLTLFMGFQALGEAIAVPQGIRIVGGVDDLARFVSVGWYGILAYGRIREEALFRVESASTRGTNV